MLLANIFFQAPGAALATLLHTLGAIAYLGGIVAWISHTRTLQRGTDNPNVLALGASLAYIGIFANLFGGFLRTFQPGHPSFIEFFTEPWAAMMVLKHVALFIGFTFAFYLFEVASPRMRKALKENRLEGKTARSGAVAIAIVLASIAISSVLGAAATVVDIGGSDPDDGLGSNGNGGDDVIVYQGGTRTFEGTVSNGSPATGSFDVPVGTAIVEASLTSSVAIGLSPYHFSLTLTDPNGTTYTGETDLQQPDAERRIHIEVTDAASGLWTYQITGTAALNAPYTLDLAFRAPDGLIQGTITIPNGAFFEINTIASPGDVLHWNWTSDGHLDWNVHTHFDEQVQYVEQEHANQGEGNYTATREGGHSYMWEATEGDVTLTYQVWGDFRLHSIYQP